MNILLTSAGRRSYLVYYFKQALNGQGLIHAANSDYTPALQAADEHVLTPLIHDASYIDFLLDYARKKNIQAIIPLFDIDLPILARAKETFERHDIKVIISSYEVTQICNDKWQTYQFFIRNNIATPKTFLDIETANTAINTQELTFPLIIKPRWGMGSIGIHSVENKGELEFFYNKTLNDIKKSYLTFESKIDFAQCVLIQEKIDGQEYSLDIINNLEGNFITTLVKRKIAMRAGETDSAETEFNPTIYNFGKNIAEKLGHIANLDTDVFLKDGKIYALELNCRFGGGYPFSHLAGADLPLAIIKWLSNEPVDSDILKIKFGITGIKDIHPIILSESSV